MVAIHVAMLPCCRATMAPRHSVYHVMREVKRLLGSLLCMFALPPTTCDFRVSLELSGQAFGMAGVELPMHTVVHACMWCGDRGAIYVLLMAAVLGV